MPVVPTTAYSQAEDALTLARALLNDAAASVFTDTLLMPFLNSAYRGLQRELAETASACSPSSRTSKWTLIPRPASRRPS